MPTKFTVIATSQTAGITFLQLTVNNQNVSLSRDSGGNISGTKVMMLPDSFPAAVTIKALLPTDWTLSLNVETIPDKKSVLKQATEESGTLVGGVASHLNHPLAGGMFGQTGETDAARFQMDEEQDVVGGETSPGKHFDGEEVGTCQDSQVGGDEIPPGGLLAPFRCRWMPYRRRMFPTV